MSSIDPTPDVPAGDRPWRGGDLDSRGLDIKLTDPSTHTTAEVVDLASLPPVACPCGSARRAFADRQELPGTIHLTEISKDASTHYHREHTEVYVILECGSDAAIELDGKRYPVKPKTSVLIPPGVRHRALGEMTVLIVCTPNFDPEDEHFDECPV